jgi:hypothetical protein
MHDGQSASVTMPESTLKLQQLTEDSKAGIWIPAKSFNKHETLGGIQKAWHMLQQWILHSDCCNTFKMAATRSTTLLEFFSAPIHQSMQHQGKACVAIRG